MRTRTGLPLGLACGCVGAMLALLGVRALHTLGGADGPSKVASTCGRASYHVTLATGPGDSSQDVTAQVAIYDPAARMWQVLWRGYGYGIVEVATDESPPIGQAAALLGDVDNGSHRQVWVRPSGDKTWCKVTAHL